MRQPRVFHPGAIEPGAQLCLSARASHHLANVLRLGQGDACLLFDGDDGGEFQAQIIRVQKKQVWVEVREQREKSVAASPLKLHLAQALLSSEKMDWVIQKAVELGVAQLTPVLTQRSKVKLSTVRLEKKLAHWQGVMIHACEQCGRTDLMTIHSPAVLSEWLLGQLACPVRLVLDPWAQSSLQTVIQPRPENMTVLIGPEGGLEKNEIESANQSGFASIRLGPRVMRTETAAVAISTVLQYQFGDLDR